MNISNKKGKIDKTFYKNLDNLISSKYNLITAKLRDNSDITFLISPSPLKATLFLNKKDIYNIIDLLNNSLVTINFLGYDKDNLYFRIKSNEFFMSIIKHYADTGHLFYYASDKRFSKYKHFFNENMTISVEEIYIGFSLRNNSLVGAYKQIKELIRLSYTEFKKILMYRDKKTFHYLINFLKKIPSGKEKIETRIDLREFGINEEITIEAEYLISKKIHSFYKEGKYIIIPKVSYNFILNHYSLPEKLAVLFRNKKNKKAFLSEIDKLFPSYSSYKNAKRYRAKTGKKSVISRYYAQLLSYQNIIVHDKYQYEGVAADLIFTPDLYIIDEQKVNNQILNDFYKNIDIDKVTDILDSNARENLEEYKETVLDCFAKYYQKEINQNNIRKLF